jgi:hypothetical protein
MRSLFPLALLLPLAGCGPDSVTIPQVPDLQSAIALFDGPTGTVPIEAASTQVQEAGRRLDALESSRIGDLLADTLAALRKRLQDNRIAPSPDTPKDPDKPEVDGYLRVHRICKGWNDASTAPDAANGTLDLLAVVRDRELQRAHNLTASACKGRVPVAQTQAFVHAFVDGTLVLGILGELPQTAEETRAVVQMNGTLGTEAGTIRLDTAFRLLDGRIELALPVSDGQIVVTRDPNGFQMRGKNGTFICSIESGTCQ